LPLLVVDDDDLLREQLEVLLSPEGFDVFGVPSSKSALEAMEALVFPIVILDRDLRDSDGLELVPELRRRYSQHRVYIIVFSSMDSDVERAKGLRAGADEYLSKANSRDQLIPSIQRGRSAIRLSSGRRPSP
jgi:DNA-binding response OmpR family regulator